MLVGAGIRVRRSKSGSEARWTTCWQGGTFAVRTGGMGCSTASKSVRLSCWGLQPNRAATRSRLARSPMAILAPGCPLMLLNIIAGPSFVGRITVPPAPT